jgi:transposase
MGRAGPRRVKAYSREFKLKAVQLSGQTGVLIRDVAESLCIHPFMLSRWRKQVRDGEITGAVPELDMKAVAELQHLREVGLREHRQARLRPRRRSLGPGNRHPAASRMDRRLQQNRSPLFPRNAFPKGVSCPQPSDFMCLEFWGAELALTRASEASARGARKRAASAARPETMRARFFI